MESETKKSIVQYLLAKKILIDEPILALLEQEDPTKISEVFTNHDDKNAFLTHLATLKNNSHVAPIPPTPTNPTTTTIPQQPTTTNSPLITPTTIPPPASPISTTPSNLQPTTTPITQPQTPPVTTPPEPITTQTMQTPTIEETPPCEVIFSYTGEDKKRTVQDFVSYFNNRYRALKGILQSRQDLQDATSISRVLTKPERERVAIIGLVTSKKETMNKNIMLEIEDPTGTIKVLVSKNKPDLIRLGKEIWLDEVIGITGKTGKEIIFADNVIYPDIPHKELKKLDKDVSIIFLSDIHLGSVDFLPESFEKFIAWINGTVGDENQKKLAKTVKYIFIVGDLVDGVGVYPGQDSELTIKDVKEQYEKFTEYIKQIPQSIRLVICPGNHDAVRIAEPQPVFSKEYAASLFTIPNATLVTNPSLLRIEESETFPGFDVLLYHGYSFDHYIAESNYIRENGGYDRADLVMKALMKRRHLAPTYKSTQFIPDAQCDPLVIEKVPDFFACGHLHKVAVAQYKHLTLVCSSCWQKKTPFQEKVGHNPEPGRVPLIDLRTRKVRVLRF